MDYLILGMFWLDVLLDNVARPLFFRHTNKFLETLFSIQIISSAFSVEFKDIPS